MQTGNKKNVLCRGLIFEQLCESDRLWLA
jgi:hypothetical protein